MAEHNDFGNMGEQLAQEYLEQKDYKILETNWRSGHNEVDIIAIKSDILVFVEVKTRRTVIWGEPQLFVTKEKQRSYIALANKYVRMNNRNEEVRFDIIAILLNNNQRKIEHIEGAFTTIF
jgi:putative endonuclease